MRNENVRLKQNWHLARESKRSRVVSNRPVTTVLNRPSSQAMLRPPLTRASVSNLATRFPATSTSGQLTTRATPVQHMSTRSLPDPSINSMPVPTATLQHGARLPIYPRSMPKCSRLRQLIILVALGALFIWLDSRMNLSSQWPGRLSYSSRYGFDGGVTCCFLCPDCPLCFLGCGVS